MNILVISHLYPKPHHPSHGIFVHRQVKQLQQLGHRLVVLSPQPWSPGILNFRRKWRDYSLTPARITWEGIEVYYPRYLRLPGAWFRALAGLAVAASAAPLALRLHETAAFDLLHTNTLLPDGLAGLDLGQKLKLPTICTVRGADAITYPYENRLNFSYSRRVVSHTEQLVAVSEALKKAGESLGTPLRPIQVVYNGVDTGLFRESGTDPAAHPCSEIPSLRPYILFVGRDIQRKGLKDLLLAYGQMVSPTAPNLVAIGPTRVEVRALAPGLVETLNGRLILPGPLPPDEIPAYMQNCELLVLPSYSEGLPNVVLEAMASSRPVIATAVMGTSEAVIDGVTGLLVQPGDVPGLVTALHALLNNPARGREMGRAGRQWVEQKFTWPQSACKLEAIYWDLLSPTAGQFLRK